MHRLDGMEWLSLVDLSEQEQVSIAKEKADSVTSLLAVRVIDETEAREIMGRDRVIGPLEGPPPEPLDMSALEDDGSPIVDDTEPTEDDDDEDDTEDGT